MERGKATDGHSSEKEDGFQTRKGRAEAPSSCYLLDTCRRPGVALMITSAVISVSFGDLAIGPESVFFPRSQEWNC